MKNDIITLNESKRMVALEQIIERGQKTFVEVGAALAEIRDSKLYRVDHDTFEDYCRDRWGWKRQRAYELIQAAEVTKALPAECNKNITNDAQARALAKVAPEKREEVIKAAAQSGKVTAKSIALAGGMVPGESPVTACRSGVLRGKGGPESAHETPPAKPAKVLKVETPEESFAKSEEERLSPKPESSPTQQIIQGLEAVIEILKAYDEPEPGDEWDVPDFDELAMEVIAIARNIKKLGDL